ncbi:hypothetical protein FHG87_013667 [Trinorchestia longiramus]|nr:hypothetical protein FHG87_013667 [Trinorchestia longiramus]
MKPKSKYVFGRNSTNHVWRQQNEDYKLKCTIPTVKFRGGSIMVWGCFSSSGGKKWEAKVVEHGSSVLFANGAQRTLPKIKIKRGSDGAYMFKFNGVCNFALDFSYNPKSEQDCDGTATEVVFITSKPLKFVGEVFVPHGESYGCLKNVPGDLTFGDEDERLVSEVQLSPVDTCCPTADKGYCMVIECSGDEMSFCEAETRCRVRGIPMA